MIRTLIYALAVFSASAALAAGPSVYVVNGTGETLSRIAVDSNIVHNNIVSLGSDINAAPNQIVIRDTLAYVVCSATDEIQVINLRSNTTAGYIELPSGSNPYWLAFYNDSLAYVSLLTANTVARLDITARQVVDQFPVGKTPEGLVVADHKLYVANTGFDFSTFMYDPGRVTVYDIGPDTLVADIAVGLNPQFLDVDREGLVHVSCTGDYFSVFGSAYVVDPQSDTVVDSVLTGGSPGQIAVGADNTVYMAAGGFTEEGFVFSYDALTGAVLHGNSDPLEVDQNCLSVAACSDSTLFTASFTDFVQRIDADGTELGRWAVGDGPFHIVVDYRPGDVNGDFETDLSDLIYMVNELFLGGPPAVWPTWRANVNGDFNRDLSDLIYMVSFLYLGGPRLTPGPTWMQ